MEWASQLMRHGSNEFTFLLVRETRRQADDLCSDGVAER
jgi:hypothetical protein